MFFKGLTTLVKKQSAGDVKEPRHTLLGKSRQCSFWCGGLIPKLGVFEMLSMNCQLLNAIWPQSLANVVKCTKLVDMEEWKCFIGIIIDKQVLKFRFQSLIRIVKTSKKLLFSFGFEYQ